MNRTDWRDDRVGSALRGENPTVLRRLCAGFAVIGDVQFLPGYSVAITDKPGVERLSDLPRPARLAFLADTEHLAEAVERVCRARDDAFRRVNIEILGNTDAFLHAHVWPRYEWEPADVVARPVWLYPSERWSDAATRLSPEHDGLREELGAALDHLQASTGIASDTHSAAQIAAVSRWIDQANARRDPEAITWGRLAKLTEESGEVIEAFIGATGQNPRKGTTHTLHDVQEELLDVAVTALGALEHLRGHDERSMELLRDKVARVTRRAGL
jgi:diadenosine tetraphosphate (Ap4A) HIT family hydrolase/NTP pyrophosphatase (non-canonical NTP hydrolase)